MTIATAMVIHYHLIYTAAPPALCAGAYAALRRCKLKPVTCREAAN